MSALTVTISDSLPSIRVALVRVAGEMDLHTCPQVRAALMSLWENGKSQIVLDLAQVPYMDSAALGVLVEGVRHAREASGGLLLCQLAPPVQRALETTRLIRIFTVYASVEGALAAAAQASD